MCHKKLYVKIANNDLEILLSIFSEEMSSLSKIENLNFYSVLVVGVGARKLKSGLRYLTLILEMYVEECFSSFSPELWRHWMIFHSFTACLVMKNHLKIGQ